MGKIDTSVLWGPKVLGRNRLDEHRWAYGVEAPFDMPSTIPDLIGARVRLDGREFEIRGTVANAPAAPIREGCLIELLVRAV